MRSEDELKNLTLGDFRSSLAQLARDLARPSVVEKLASTLSVNGVLRKELLSFDVKEMRTDVGVIDAMTAEERRDHKLVDPSRARRIATGSGVDLQRVNHVLKQYETMKRMR